MSATSPAKEKTSLEHLCQADSRGAAITSEPICREANEPFIVSANHLLELSLLYGYNRIDEGHWKRKQNACLSALEIEEYSLMSSETRCSSQASITRL